jgi:SAM-dependent methyltransferase
MREFRDRRFKHHSLLGLRTVESTDSEPGFRNLFHLEAAPWVRDHTINGDVVYPFAAYVAMAGEAIRQLTGVQHGFRLRDTTATTALVVHEDKPVELITALRRRKLADGSDSRWWDFGISSHNGHVWVRHFTGEATALGETETLGPAEHLELPELPRPVDAAKWYAAVDRTGFHYGSTFRCLQDVKAATTQPGRVTATIAKAVGLGGEDESDYHIHPTAVDNVFQMLPAASLLGRDRKLGLNVITGIGELTIARCTSDAVLEASVSGQTAGDGSLLVGGGECAVDGRVVLRMSDTTFSVLGHPDDGGDPHAAARHIWAPHVDFVAPEKLLKLARQHGDSDIAASLAELSELALLHASKTLAGLEQAPTADHLRRYQSWVATQTAQALQNGAHLDSNDDGGLVERIGAKVRSLQGSAMAGDVAEAIYRVATGLGDVLTGRMDGLDLLSKDNLLDKVVGYVNNEVDKSSFLGALAHTQPNMRILELGAGSGALTDKHLEGLGSLYSKYTFTDASQRLVAEGKERLKDRANMEFAALDIGGDLATYGFDLADSERPGYDLILATNVLNQTHDLARSMRNMRSLLNPGGRLLLQELAPCAASRWATFVLGACLPSWWRGVPEGNQDLGIPGPALEHALDAAGFAQPDIQVLAGPEAPCRLNNVVVARPTATAGSRPKQVAILTANAAYSESPQASTLHQQLAARGYDVSRITLADDKPPAAGKDVVALLDHDNGAFLSDISPKAYQRLNRFLLDLVKSQAGLFWITRPSSTGAVSDPHHGLVVGLARTLRSEMDAEFAVCQTAGGGLGDERVIQVFEHFHRRPLKAAETSLGPEMEYAISDDGEVHVGRYYPFTLRDELLDKEGADGEAVLAIGRPGNLDELRWVQRAVHAPEDDGVEVEVYAAGLNDKVCMRLGLFQAEMSPLLTTEYHTRRIFPMPLGRRHQPTRPFSASKQPAWYGASGQA